VRFVGVVGDIPAGSLELDGRGRDHLFDAASALRAFLDHLVGKFLDFFEAVTALFTLIFVKRHGLRWLSGVEIFLLFNSRGVGSLASITRARGWLKLE
jgi:hypothetical protein